MLKFVVKLNMEHKAQKAREKKSIIITNFLNDIFKAVSSPTLTITYTFDAFYTKKKKRISFPV